MSTYANPIDRTNSDASGLASFIDTAAPGTWFTYYEGLSIGSDAKNSDRNLAVGNLIRAMARKGKVYPVLKCLRQGDDAKAGRYAWRAVTANPPKSKYDRLLDRR